MRPQEMQAANRGFFVCAVISAIGVAIVYFTFLPARFSDLKGITDPAIAAYNGDPRWLGLGAMLTGIVLANAIQLLTN